jgi:hypothetical protein
VARFFVSVRWGERSAGAKKNADENSLDLSGRTIHLQFESKISKITRLGTKK